VILNRRTGGYDFPLSGVKIWEPDVFAFLDKLMHP
jgi:hypothetical protein